MFYRGFTQDELQREYAPSSTIGGDNSAYLAAYAALSDAARAQLCPRENLSYGTAATQVLDYFDGPTPAAPLHVFIHGGYWQALSHRDGASMAPGIVGRGSAFATLNYTLAPEARLAEMVAECRDALLWLVRNAADLGFDPHRVTISGHSAGAHLAAMVLTQEAATLKAAGMTVTDAILISGILDLEPLVHTMVNAPLQLTEAEIATLSPMTQLPTFGGHTRVTVGSLETGEFIRQSRSYAERLRRAGHAVSFDLQHGLQHFDIILHDATFVPGSTAS